MRQRESRSLLVWMLAAYAFLVAGHKAGLTINTTDSMPIGLWLEEPARPARKGDVLLICLPAGPLLDLAWSRGYLASGYCPTGAEVMMKPVAAAAGDQIVVSPAGVIVNGISLRNSAQLPEDSQGRLLPVVYAEINTVPAGELWLVSEHNVRSFDSRYFGQLSQAAVQGVVRPLWTMR